MWYKEGIISFDDSNFDTKYYPFLVDVKLLETRILDWNWKKTRL